MKAFFLLLSMMASPVLCFAGQNLIAPNDVKISAGKPGVEIAYKNGDICYLITNVQAYDRKISSGAKFEILDVQLLPESAPSAREIHQMAQIQFGIELDPQQNMTTDQIIAVAKEKYNLGYKDGESYSQLVKIQSQISGSNLSILCRTSVQKTASSLLDFLFENASLKPAPEL